jgi:phage shock protein PspC (stress-responsive transcriptional regulator)
MTERWVVGGVAAELATRLRASSSFIRVLLFVAMWLQPAGILVAYGAAALLLPRGGARVPQWSGLVACTRFGAVLVLIALPAAGGLTLDEFFSSGPATWIPLGGVTAAALIALFAWRPAIDEVDESRCRVLVLSALPAVAVAAIVVAGMVLAPGVRWDPVLAALVLALAAALAVFRAAPAALVPAAALGVTALILAGAGARLEGGIGDLGVAPRQDGVVVAERAVGDVRVDLTALPKSATDVWVTARTGVGEVRVVLPPRAVGSADVRVGRGRISPGRLEGEVDARRQLTGVSTVPRRAPLRVRIVAESGFGDVRISRVGARGQGGDF